MSKLVSLKRPRPGKLIRLPFPSEAVTAHVTVVLLKNGAIELSGYVEHEAFATKMLEHGKARLIQWHAKKRLIGETAPPLGGSVGEPGAEAAGNGEAVPASPLPGAMPEVMDY